jgi:hypothetical protein
MALLTSSSTHEKSAASKEGAMTRSWKVFGITGSIRTTEFLTKHGKFSSSGGIHPILPAFETRLLNQRRRFVILHCGGSLTTLQMYDKKPQEGQLAQHSANLSLIK